MSGNKEGAALAVQTIKERYGLDENGKSIKHMQAGRKGGIAHTNLPKGFAAHPELARIAGAKGGKISRKPKKVEE